MWRLVQLWSLLSCIGEAATPRPVKIGSRSFPITCSRLRDRAAIEGESRNAQQQLSCAVDRPISHVRSPNGTRMAHQTGASALAVLSRSRDWAAYTTIRLTGSCETGRVLTIPLPDSSLLLSEQPDRPARSHRPVVTTRMAFSALNASDARSAAQGSPFFSCFSQSQWNRR